jgi:hypothetical protein
MAPLAVDFLSWVGAVAVVYWHLRVRRDLLSYDRLYCAD